MDCRLATFMPLSSVFLGSVNEHITECGYHAGKSGNSQRLNVLSSKISQQVSGRLLAICSPTSEEVRSAYVVVTAAFRSHVDIHAMDTLDGRLFSSGISGF